MEKPPVRRQFAIQLLAGLATIVAVAVLYFFPPLEYAFYPRCLFHSLTGLNCPFCGCLRATHQLLHGHFQMALALNPLFVLLILPVFVVLSILKMMATIGRKNFKPSPPRVSIWIFVGVITTFGIIRNFPAFSWMSP